MPAKKSTTTKAAPAAKAPAKKAPAAKAPAKSAAAPKVAPKAAPKAAAPAKPSKPFPIRSPRDKVMGFYVVGRLIDKVRLDEIGELPKGYHRGLVSGSRTFDDRFCRLLQIDYMDFEERVQAGGPDEEILSDLLEIGITPDEEQMEIWNTFMEKRGWRDSASKGLAQQKKDAGLGDRDDILTFFDLMDVEEGRSI